MGKSFIKDFSWYFLGSMLPIIIGIIKTPIFTRHFNETDYGYLGIVTVTFSFLSMILFSWISSCLWRFYAKYESRNKLNKLYSNLFFLFLIAFFVLFIFSGVWYSIENFFLVKKLIAYSFIHLLFNQLYQFYIIIIRIEGRAMFYTIFQSVRAVISLITVLIFVFIFESTITALISSLILVDFFAVLFLITVNPSKILIKLGLVRKIYLNELLIYGSAGLLINVCFLVISSSDRFIIAWLGDIKDVGVYDQVYKISQLSIAALVAVFFNTINPTLLNELENHFKDSKHLIRKYLNAFVIYGFPIIFYLSVFSEELSNILLGKEFRVGYSIMPFVFVSAYLHGISNFYELRLKFTNQLRKLSTIIIGVTLFNVLITILFVSLYGYKWAAITTAITYGIALLIFHFLDQELILFSRNNITFILKVLLFFTFQIVIYKLVNANYELTSIRKIMLSLTFIIIYFFIIKSRLKNLNLSINY